MVRTVIKALDRERLVTDNLWIVHDLARKHVARRWAHPDLVAAGYLGLVKAAKNFQEGAFAPYAATAVRREMLHFLKQCAWPVRLPRNQAAPAPNWTRVPFFQVDESASLPGIDVPESRELAPVVEKALVRIPEPWRQTMRLFYLGDYRISDLARRFGISLEGVRARLRKGRALLAAETRRRPALLAP